ncbi:MAG: hypothetical protein CO025_10060, partial [Ignavibacteria bacterium CG_4_9_14_0_2_um_filter_37_13]
IKGIVAPSFNISITVSTWREEIFSSLAIISGMCINDPCTINERENFPEMKERRKIVIYQLEKEKRFSMP